MMKNREQAERHSAASVGVVAFLSNGDPPKRSTRPPFLLELVSKIVTKCKIIVGKAVLRFGTGGKSSHRRRRHALVGF